MHRPRQWRAVVTVNGVGLTIFLWHLSAVVLLVGALNIAHWLPPSSVGTGAWWVWRVPWLLVLAAILTGLVATLGPLEARTIHPTSGQRYNWATSRPRATLRTALVAIGYAGVITGLSINSAARMAAPEPLGLPPGALVAYLAGAGILWILRSPQRGVRRLTS
jgi:hypothetical protein